MTLVVKVCLLFRVLLLVSKSAALSFKSANDVVVSCSGSKYVSQKSGLCAMVSWNSAALFLAANYSNYDHGTALTTAQQLSYAQFLYDSYREAASSKSSLCHATLKEYACLQAFPQCPDNGAISYFPPCKMQCQQSNAQCDLKQDLDCSALPSTGCTLLIAAGYFVFDPTQGPYGNIYILYAIVFPLWFLMTGWWIFSSFHLHSESSMIIWKTVAPIPALKTIILAITLAFWYTCRRWDLCSFWMGVALQNIQLIYESAQMVAFMLVAKGWGYNRDYFSITEWRCVVTAMCVFYMANSIIEVLAGTVLNDAGYYIIIAILYGSVYLSILRNGNRQLIYVTNITKLFSNQMQEQFTSPIIHKRRMFAAFQLLVLCSLVCEAVLHAMRHELQSILPVLVVYEVSNLLIFLLIGFLFRPVEYSPYFFMVPTTADDQRTRPIPMIEVLDEDEDSAKGDSSSTSLAHDVELGPLLGLTSPSAAQNQPITRADLKLLDASLILVRDVKEQSGFAVGLKYKESTHRQTVMAGNSAETSSTSAAIATVNPKRTAAAKAATRSTPQNIEMRSFSIREAASAAAAVTEREEGEQVSRAQMHRTRTPERRSSAEKQNRRSRAGDQTSNRSKLIQSASQISAAVLADAENSADDLDIPLPGENEGDELLL